MEYHEFLDRVINEGIEAAKADYNKPEDKERLDGSVAGFEACRNKQPDELKEIFWEATEYANRGFITRADNYWYFRCYQLEVEWVCNVVSALLYNAGAEPIFIHLPTANGMIKAASIVGVASTQSRRER